MLDVSGFVGIPYRGENFCRVFAAQFLAAHGIDMPQVDTPDAAENWQRVPRARPLDVVVLNEQGRPGHVGVCIGSGRLLHVERGKRSCVERLDEFRIASKIEGFYRCRK